MKEKRIIRFGLKYWICPAFSFLLSIIVIMIGIFLFKGDDDLILKILSYAMMSAISIVFLLATLQSYQFAILENDIIEIRSIITSFCCLKIDTITSIKKESIATFRNSYGATAYNDWLVFYTNDTTNVKEKFGLNRRSDKAYRIPFNESNLKIIKEFFVTNKMDFPFGKRR